MVEGVKHHSLGGWAGVAAVYTNEPPLLKKENLCVWRWLRTADVK